MFKTLFYSIFVTLNNNLNYLKTKSMMTLPSGLNIYKTSREPIKNYSV